VEEIMRLRRREFMSLVASTAALPLSTRIVHAQTYPARPVRVVVPFAPGGPTDIFARIITQKLSERLGKQFYVDNVAGATGNIGTAQVAKATPDGHTILICVTNLVTNTLMFNTVQYDPFKDFEPISLPVIADIAFVVHPSIPATTVAELAAEIRAGKSKFSYASGGVGSLPHLMGEQFKQALGLDIVHVPYGGGGPSAASVVAGHTQMAFSATPQVVPHVKDRALRALAVVGKKRSRSLPDTPTMIEAGFPQSQGDQWVGVLGPAGTPKDIVALLDREIQAAMSLPDTQERFAVLGYEVVGGGPEDLTAQIRTDFDIWAKVIRAGNLKPG
jgi:tripartite-type tricarboxylate transporter receptor subunit TctC